MLKSCHAEFISASLKNLDPETSSGRQRRLTFQIGPKKNLIFKIKNYEK